MNKNLAVAASAATLLIFLGAGCSEMPKAEENEKLEKTEQVTETEVKTEPVAQQTAPTAVQKEREEENENEDEREEGGTATTQPQVKPVAPAPAPTTAPTVKTYTMAEVQKANNGSNCWSVISGKVYDLTSFTPGHPGGEPAILSLCGKDGTSGFMAQHGGQRKPESVLGKFYLGNLK